MRPLRVCIGHRPAEVAGGSDAAFPGLAVTDDFVKMIEKPAGFQPADSLAIKRSGALLPQSGLDVIDATDQKQDSGGEARMVVLGFGELPADVNEAGNRRDGQVRMALDEGAIGAQAVALEVAAEGRFVVFANEDGVQTGVGAAFVPVEEHTVFGVMIDPEASAPGSPGARQSLVVRPSPYFLSCYCGGGSNPSISYGPRTDYQSCQGFHCRGFHLTPRKESDRHETRIGKPSSHGINASTPAHENPLQSMDQRSRDFD